MARPDTFIKGLFKSLPDEKLDRYILALCEERPTRKQDEIQSKIPDHRPGVYSPFYRDLLAISWNSRIKLLFKLWAYEAGRPLPDTLGFLEDKPEFSLSLARALEEIHGIPHMTERECYEVWNSLLELANREKMEVRIFSFSQNLARFINGLAFYKVSVLIVNASLPIRIKVHVLAHEIGHTILQTDSEKDAERYAAGICSYLHRYLHRTCGAPPREFIAFASAQAAV